MNKFFLTKLVVILVFMTFISSCKEIIEYSPYENIVDAKWKNQNQKEYNRLLPEASKSFEPFRVGLISDSHTYYDEFVKQVSYLNTRNDLDFIIHLGDITLSSNSREFKWYSDILDRIEVPVFTIIGNHDCLGNGYDIFVEMFGDPNLYFAYKDVKFVLFDNIVWEKNIKDPDFEWLTSAVVNDKNHKHVIPFSHIFPWDSQFSYGNELVYNYILEQNNISLSVHGHGHSYKLSNPYDSVDYLIVPSCSKDEIVILDIQADTIKIERVHY